MKAISDTRQGRRKEKVAKIELEEIRKDNICDIDID